METLMFLGTALGVAVFIHFLWKTLFKSVLRIISIKETEEEFDCMTWEKLATKAAGEYFGPDQIAMIRELSIPTEDLKNFFNGTLPFSQRFRIEVMMAKTLLLKNDDEIDLFYRKLQAVRRFALNSRRVKS